MKVMLFTVYGGACAVAGAVAATTTISAPDWWKLLVCLGVIIFGQAAYRLATEDMS